MTMNVQHVLIPSSDYETHRNPTFSRLIFRCSFWSKYCVFVINFFVWVGGVCLMSAGAWAQLEKSRYDTFNSFTNDPALILLLIGVIMFVMSAFGCVGSLRENICLLKTFCLMTAAVFVGELTAGSFTISLSNRLEEELVEDLYNAIQLYGAEKKFTDDIDYVQKRFECCGAKSYDDWQLNKLYNCSANFPSRCGVPTSCCKLDNSPTCGYQTRINGVQYASYSIRTKGCVYYLMKVFKNNLTVIGFIAFVVGLLEIIAIILAIMQLKHLEKIQRGRSSEDVRLKMTVRKVYNSHASYDDEFRR